MLLAVVGDLGRDVLPVLLVYLVDFLHLEYEDDPLEPLLGGGGEQLDNVLHDMPVHQLVGPEKDHVYFDPHFVKFLSRQQDWCCQTLIVGYIVRNIRT